VSKETPGVRYAEMERETYDNRVRVVLDLDGERRATISTRVGYFDHMLTLFAYHGGFDLGISVEGELGVDDHHTLVDVGTCLGGAVRQAIGDGQGINRYGTEHAPMAEALARVVIDLSGRPFVNFDVSFTNERIGEMSSESVEQFFKAAADHAGMTIHVHQLAGHNNHHVCEAIFKAFGRSLRRAIAKVDAHGGAKKGAID